jgi:hypothetical protein
MTQAKTTRGLAGWGCLGAAVLLAACGQEPAPLAAVSDERPVEEVGEQSRDPSGPRREAPLLSLPPSLSCVSSSLPGSAGTDRVIRLWIARDIDGSAIVSTQRGPLFSSHENGLLTGDFEDSVTRTLGVKEGRTLVLSNDEGLTVSLTRDQLVFRGTVVDDECYQITEVPVVCWNEVELFGSAWAGAPGILPARFDWASGACRDAEGNAALNPLPIEVIRETGFGDCADLRGVALNGGDFGYPSLIGWQLRGANLEGASLFFANLRWASLEGADLSSLQFGYAEIEGFIDDNTRLPTEGACAVSVHEWGMSELFCHR